MNTKSASHTALVCAGLIVAVGCAAQTSQPAAQKVQFSFKYDEVVRKQVKEMATLAVMLQKRLETVSSENERAALSPQLGLLLQRLQNKDAIYLNANEVAELKARLDSVNSGIEAALFPKRSFLIWAGKAWENFGPYDIPGAPSENLQPLEACACRNEYTSAAFMVTNIGVRSGSFKVQVAPPVNSRGREQAEIVVRSAYFLAAAGGSAWTPVALPRAEDGTVKIPPGQTGQVWLTIKSLESAESGIYECPVEITPSDSGQATKLTLKLTILPLLYPQKADVHACTYGYLNPADKSRSQFWPVRDEAVEDLLAHCETHFVVDCYYTPMPRVDSTGKITSLDFSRLDRALELYRGADFYMFLWGVGNPLGDFLGSGETYPSIEWKKSLSTWLNLWVAHLREKGIGYDRFAMYPLDESHADSLSKICQAIKEADPKIRTYATIGFWYYSLDDLRKIAPYVDMMCISQIDKGEKLDFLQKSGKILWPENQPNPSKSLPPYTFKWVMWKWYDMKLDGCEAWAYNAACDSLWSDFDGKYPDEAFVFDGATAPFKTTEAIIPGKHWEAWREGIQDWQHLKDLEKMIDRAREAGVNPSMVQRASRVLESTVQSVISNKSDASMASKGRLAILGQMVDLQKAMGGSK